MGACANVLVLDIYNCCCCLCSRGEMIIAEVTSRFLSVNKFVSEVEGHGFHLIRKVFHFFECLKFSCMISNFKSISAWIIF